MPRTLLHAIVAGAPLLFVSALGFAQTVPPRGGQAPRSAEAFDPRDLSAVWGAQTTGQSDRTLIKGEPPMTAWGLAKYKSARTEYSKPPAAGTENNDPIYRCEPESVPRTYGVAHPIEIVQTPKETLMLIETNRNFRILYTDGRKQPDHPEGTWFGDSVARWEGNSLVADTVNFNDRNWIDQVGHPHSDKLHLVERLTRADRDHLKMEITIDDPVAYTRPWGGTITWTLEPEWQIQDFLCSAADEAHMRESILYQADPKGPGK